VQQSATVWGLLIAVLVLAIGLGIWFVARQPEPGTGSGRPELPSGVAGWQRAPGGQHYDPETIFSYIDGHAEVYLAYGMQGCNAEKYQGPEGEPDLILDIFEMASPADAFGVFTHDSEGEEVGVGRESRYRYGWLSFWQGPYFVSILAEAETPLAERATLDLGRQIAALLPDRGSRPPIVDALPTEDLVASSVRYLHHPQILNTHLPVDPENLLELGMDTPAALGTYSRGEESAHLLIVDYPQAKRAESARQKAFDRLCEGASVPAEGVYSGCRRMDNRLAVVFEAPSERWVTTLLQAAVGSGEIP
jgi:hypothetical protein